MQPASAPDVTVLAAHASSFVVVRLAVQHRLIQPLMTNSLPIAARRMGVALVAASAFSLVVPRVAYAQALSGTIIMRVTATCWTGTLSNTSRSGLGRRER